MNDANPNPSVKPPALDDIPGGLETCEGLPHPRWDIIWDWVDERYDDSSWGDVWTEIARQWLDKLAEHLPPGYRTWESDEFFLLCREAEEVAERLLRWCEGYRLAILRVLDGIVDDAGAGKHVVLAMHNQDTYYRYLSRFHPEGHFGGSSGTFLSWGYGHIILCGVTWGTDRTLVHELIHAIMRDFPLPRWLSEGFTQVAEDTVLENSWFRPTAELMLRQKAYWSKNGMEGFWSGDAFHLPDEGQELSYSLAKILVLNLVSDYRKRLPEFLEQASYTDAGEEACRATFGVGLGERVAQALGPGDWAPKTTYGQTE
jgi:hypothetical protein